jgi:hypothetical protein
MEVATQQSLPNWTLFQWANYFSSPDKSQLLNVISLEISDSRLGASIQRPKIVRDLDWVDNVWPVDLKPTEYPKVQLYCLMSPGKAHRLAWLGRMRIHRVFVQARCWTDFHVDFGGSSVFYHIVKGSKTFYFIPPTEVDGWQIKSCVLL